MIKEMLSTYNSNAAFTMETMAGHIPNVPRTMVAKVTARTKIIFCKEEH